MKKGGDLLIGSVERGAIWGDGDVGGSQQRMEHITRRSTCWRQVRIGGGVSWEEVLWL